MVFFKYSTVSTMLTSAVIWYAYTTREEFYPTVKYLVTSKIAVATIGNQLIVLTVWVGRVLKTMFLGSLREAEIELLYENARYAITETCLALTIFREELTARVLCLFTVLLFAKVFHWLAASRVEYLEHAEEDQRRASWTTHIRLSLLMWYLAVGDVAAAAACGYACYRAGKATVLLLFGFEFAILGISVAACAMRYVLYGVERRVYDGQWASKGNFAFAVDFAAELIRFLCYVGFFAIIFTYYGIPLHIVRELWASYVSLKRRLLAYRRYRLLTRDMDRRFPDATDEDLERHPTCIICREPNDTRSSSSKTLPCGHVFHLDCLRLWLQQQQTCPTCRAEIPVVDDAQTAPGRPPRSGQEAAPPEVNNAAQPIVREEPAQPGGPQGGPPLSEGGQANDNDDDLVARLARLGGGLGDGMIPGINAAAAGPLGRRPLGDDNAALGGGGPLLVPRDFQEDDARPEERARGAQPDGAVLGGGERVTQGLRRRSTANEEAARAAATRRALSVATAAATTPSGSSSSVVNSMLAPVPPDARVYRVVAPLGARVLSERRLDAPARRFLTAGANVLAVDDDADSGFLRLADGWLPRDPGVVVPFSPDPMAAALDAIFMHLADIRADVRALREAVGGQRDDASRAVAYARAVAHAAAVVGPMDQTGDRRAVANLGGRPASDASSLGPSSSGPSSRNPAETTTTLGGPVEEEKKT